MSVSVPSLHRVRTIFTIVKGIGKGSSFQMVSDKIVIGRDRTNDICIRDPRSSRRHALIEQVAGTLRVRDLSSQNGIMLNGTPCKTAQLNHRDVISIGDTDIQLQIGESAELMEEKSTRVMKSEKKKGNRVIFYIIVFALAYGTYLLLKNQKMKNNDYGLTTDRVLEAQTEAAKKYTRDILRSKMISGRLSRQFREAQSNYIRGFREYQQENYSAAIQSFSAALAIFPKHKLANKYLDFATKRLFELAQEYLTDADIYFESGRYEMSRSSYENVMNLINDRNNKTYQFAKERIKTIELIVKDRY